MKTMKCKCGEEIEYNYSYECFECGCGNTYNALGQGLRPREDWQDEWDNDDY